MLQKRIIKKILGVVVVTIAIAEVSLVVSHFVNFSGKKSKIVRELEENFGGKASIKGKVYFKLFPVPKFVLTHLRLYDVEAGLFKLDLRSPEVSFHVSPFAFLFGSIDVSDIEIKNAKIEFKMAWLESKKRGKLATNFDFINIVDSDIIISNDRFNLYKEFNGVEATVVSSSSKKVDLNYHASFESMLNKYTLSSSMQEENGEVIFVKSKIESRPKNSSNSYQNIAFNFDVDTKFFASNASLSSKINISGNDIQHFIFNHIYRKAMFFPDKSMDDFSASLEVKFKNGILDISNLELKSKPITGDFNLNFDLNGNGKAEANILSMSTDALMSDETTEYARHEMLVLGKDDQLKFSLLSDASFELDILADNLVVSNNHLSDFSTKFIFQGSDKKLFKTDFVNFGVNKVNASGEIIYDEEKDTNNVVGKIESEGDDFGLFLTHFVPDLRFVRDNSFKIYKFLADFNFADNLFSLTNIDAKIDDFDLSGDAVVSNTEKSDDIQAAKETSSKINLVFNGVNFDQYYLFDNGGIRRHFFDYLYSLIANKNDSKTVFQRFLWLRNVLSEVSFDIFVDQFVYGGNPGENMLISGVLRHRLLSIEKFSILDSDDDFNCKFSVDIGDIPEITFNMQGKKLNLKNFTYPEPEKKVAHTWSKEIFRLPRLESMVTNFDISLDSLTYGKLLIRDLILKTDFRKGTLYFDKFTGQIFDKGNFNIQGYYIISGLPTLSLAFQFANLEVSKLFDFLFNQKSFDTLASISGNLNTFGQSMSVFIRQLSANIKYRTGNVVINDFGIGAVVNYIANMTKLEVYESDFDLSRVVESGSTVYNPIKGDFIVRKGKAVINNLRLQNDGMNSNIIGKIDIPTYQLFVTTIHVFRAYYLSGDDVENASLRIDYTLRGAFDSLTSTFDEQQVKKLIADLKQAYLPLIEKHRSFYKNLEEERKKREEELKKQKEQEQQEVTDE